MRAISGSSRPWPRPSTRAPWPSSTPTTRSALRRLREEGKVKILKFDDSLLRAFLDISQEVVAEAGAVDDLTRRIYASYQQFRASIMDWSDVAERAFMNARRLA